MALKKHPFRQTKLRPHHFPRLYFDADYVKPLGDSERLFTKDATEGWIDTTIGFKSIRHPKNAHHSDPICMMLTVDALMRIDVHSMIWARDLAPWMEKWYHDYYFDVRQVGRMLDHVEKAQKLSAAPKFGKWTAMNRFRDRAVWYYSLYPDRETYIWLAKMRTRLEEASRMHVKAERKARKHIAYSNFFDMSILADPQDPNDHSNVPITPGIVFRTQ